MEIRKVKKSDLVKCAKLLQQAYESEPYNEKFEEDNAYNYIVSKYDICHNTSFVILDDDTIVGFVFFSLSFWTEGRQAILEEIVIANNQQNKGVGKKLVSFSHDFLKREGVKSVMLWAKKDPKVIGFHNSNGYFVADSHCVMFKDLN